MRRSERNNMFLVTQILWGGFGGSGGGVPYCGGTGTLWYWFFVGPWMITLSREHGVCLEVCDRIVLCG